MHILGISCFYHDAASALVSDGILTAAAQEERFTGKKHDADFPSNAIRFCLEKGRVAADNLDAIVFYDKPFTKFDRILNGYLATVPRSYQAFRKAIPVWLREKLWLPHRIHKDLHFHGDILFVEHHLSHAAGTYFSSPFKQAAILTVDGVGEWATASIGHGRDNQIRLTQVMNYPHSVGLLYSAFTYFLGFQVNSAEYKVMGLAPYGQPQYAELIEREIVRIFDDGSIHLNPEYFTFQYGLTMTGTKFEALFGRPRRHPESELTDSDRDIAASIQNVAEKIIFRMAEQTKKLTNENKLCLSGGVALNCSATGKLLKAGLFDEIYIQPASSDSGGAVGAALYAHYSLTGSAKKNNQPYFSLGPTYTWDNVSSYLNDIGASYENMAFDDLAEYLAAQLAQRKIVGLFHGPMEFGPRALGFRSILADPRDIDMKTRINKAVKFREPFRPFAPVVLEEKASEYFDTDRPSPYMLFNFTVQENRRDTVPAITHVDGTSRIQTVNQTDNRLLYHILQKFEYQTGVAVLLNTSLNLRGHPIARTPQDAFATFISSGIDIMAIENCVLDKNKIDPASFAHLHIATGRD
ncbi:MAG: carbamoyltransferase [candidate division Zixibacteria bacterium]|nr:carbamoyltransferase [candidate division Zixibacteria bacterium]